MATEQTNDLPQNVCKKLRKLVETASHHEEEIPVGTKHPSNKPCLGTPEASVPEQLSPETEDSEVELLLISKVSALRALEKAGLDPASAAAFVETMFPKMREHQLELGTIIKNESIAKTRTAKPKCEQRNGAEHPIPFKSCRSHEDGTLADNLFERYDLEQGRNRPKIGTVRWLRALKRELRFIEQEKAIASILQPSRSDLFSREE